jgi:hypothetical protein
VYLNSVLAEKIYMLPPEDGSMGNIPEEMVLLVGKGFYGLKQSGKTWYDTVDGKFAEYGFVKLDVDHGIYTRIESDGRFILIGLYVDDLALASKSRPYLDSFKAQFVTELEMSDLGESRWFLAMCILRNCTLGILSINQSQYIERILEEYGMTDCKGISTLMEKGLSLSRCDEDRDNCINVPYQRVVSSFIFAKADLFEMEWRASIPNHAGFNILPGIIPEFIQH